MKYTILFVVLFFMLCGSSSVRAQNVAVKFNTLGVLNGSLAAGVEYALGPRSTFQLSGHLRPWKRQENQVSRYWIIEPEYRYWTCQKFNGAFWGGYLSGAQFNVGGRSMPFGLFPGLKAHRYEGWSLGGGINYGYQWMLNRYWNVEICLGVGYNYFRYKEYECPAKCAGLKAEKEYHYFGPNKASLSIVYVF